MTVVIGTAGHIDHGKTTLLRALTGIDADRLPEERRRGLTIDVGYAHLALGDDTELDFVDVPGHDRLVGNMLVGAGEIDAVLLVVAADDGLRAQTHEHLALLDALVIRHGIVAITKTDLVEPSRADEVRRAVGDRLAGTSLADAPIVAVSAATGSGIDSLCAELGRLRDLVSAARSVRPVRPARLAVDRAFVVKGRGLVVTGSLRGGRIATGDVLNVVPGPGSARVREIQVHGAPLEAVEGGGRVALNIVLSDADGLRRGDVLTFDPDVTAGERLLVELASAPRDRARFRFHLGTAAADAVIGRGGRDAIELPAGGAAAIVRLDAPVAVAVGDRFVLRRVTPSEAVGGIVLDPAPARGVSRRRQSPARVADLAAAVQSGDRAAIDSARTALHGLLDSGDGPRLAGDVRAALRAEALDAVRADHVAHPNALGPSLAAVRAALARGLRRHVTVRAAEAPAIAGSILDELAADGSLVAAGDRVRLAGHRPAPRDPALETAMDRLEAALAARAPAPLAEAAARAGCPPAGVRELERTGRIVVLAPDVAYAMSTYRDLAATALALAAAGPLAPAAFRDATGTSRKYVMPILEDLDRRGILRRTPAGHLPGPRAPRPQGSRS